MEKEEIINTLKSLGFAGILSMCLVTETANAIILLLDAYQDVINC